MPLMHIIVVSWNDANAINLIFLNQKHILVEYADMYI